MGKSGEGMRWKLDRNELEVELAFKYLGVWSSRRLRGEMQLEKSKDTKIGRKS